MRASHAERDRAGDVLKAGYAEGRLDKDEFDRRMHLAQRAVTQGELQRLLHDLPQGPSAQPSGAQGVPGSPAPYAPHAPLAPRHGYLPAYGPPLAATPMPVHQQWPPPSRRTNGSAVAALVCGLTVMFYGLTAIPAVILGHKARAEIRRTGEEGDGMAVTGLVFGYLALAFWLVVLCVVILVATL
jgi:uncharacterized membrane protein